MVSRCVVYVAVLLLVLALTACTGSVQVTFAPAPIGSPPPDTPSPSIGSFSAHTPSLLPATSATAADAPPSPAAVSPALDVPLPSRVPSPSHATPAPSAVDKALPSDTKVIPSMSPPPPSPTVVIKDVTSKVIKDLVKGVNDARAEARTPALGTLNSLIASSRSHAIAMATRQEVFRQRHGDREGAARYFNYITPRQAAYMLARSSGIDRDAALGKMGAGLCFSSDGYFYLCITANHVVIVVSPHG